MSNIHPNAVVEDGVVIGQDVTVEPFAVVKSGAVLGDGVTIKSHAYIEGNTTIGDGSSIWPGASIGCKAQDRKYSGEKTYVRIGKNTQVREYVTVNASCGEGSAVTIGDECLLMACVHVAHNCVVGNHVTLSNNVLLAGHVTIEDFVNVGGMTPIHQRVRIGAHSMVGGLSRVHQDIPPYTIGGGIPYKMGGLNLVGLRRRNFSLETRRCLTRAFRLIYRSNLELDEALVRIEQEVELIAEVRHLLSFCRQSSRGLIGLEGITRLPEANYTDLSEYLEEAEPLQQVR